MLNFYPAPNNIRKTLLIQLFICRTLIKVNRGKNINQSKKDITQNNKNVKNCKSFESI